MVKSSYITDKVAFYAKQKWLDLEIKHLYSKRSMLELQAYDLFQKLTFKLSKKENEQWDDFQRKMFVSINAKVIKKRASLNNKLKNLCHNQSKVIKNVPKKAIDIVENHSSQIFEQDELDLLNKGLNYALPGPSNVLEEVVASVECAIQRMSDTSKGFVREACSKQISKNLPQANNKKMLRSKNEMKVIKRLREKDCFYLKADKGNKVVILNKDDYYGRVDELIKNGPYKKLPRNPLPKMISEVKSVFKSCNHLVTPTIKYKLQVSNPVVPKIYCLPKIHKPGKSVRPIVSAIGSPTYNLSKWLTKEFENLPIAQPSYSVINSNDFIDRIKNIQLQQGEILISFDVCSLFPSIPIPQTLDYLKDLLETNGLRKEVVKEYIELTKLCMKQNCFQFNSGFFEQHEGTAMGNSLSPFIANLFMSRFETEAKEQFEYFPRVWLRYVDDIFVIFDTKRADVNEFILKLNNLHSSVNFTYEIENNEQLPFLDVLVIRNNENKLEFDIFRKDTNTLRYIPNDSHHCAQHKMASMNFLVHRLMSVPLNKDRFEKERNLIKDIAEANGYSTYLVDKLIRKRKFKDMIRSSTTFQNNVDNSKLISIPYEPHLTRGLKKIFKDVGMTVVYKSGNKIKQLLGNPKDKIGTNEKSGIYEISCIDCDQKYVGQTKRSILTRFKEHMAHLKYGRTEKSAVAQHAFENDHRINMNNLKLIRNVTDPRQLDAFESLEISKCKKLMNNDSGPIPYSTLFKLVDRVGRRHDLGG